MINKRSQWCFNNFLATDVAYSFSSQNSSHPFTNLFKKFRSRYWQAGGNFEIKSTNNKVYINGSTFTLTNGNYTATSLITHFNSVTSQTLSRNSLGRFVITLGASGTINLSSTTDAIWSTLGFLGTTNLTGTVFTADERRYNNGEWLKVDLGLPQKSTFACLIPANETVFSCSNAVIKLQGNNADNWDNPPINLTMQTDSTGSFVTLDEDLIACRFWRIYIEDFKNPEIKVSVAYVGDSVQTRNTNVAIAFSRNRVDPSERFYSQGGQVYVNRRPRYLTMQNVSVELMADDDLKDLEQLIFDLGVGRPFFLVTDPSEAVSTSLSQMTHYLEVESEPSLSHVLNKYYNLSIGFREVI